MRSREDLTRELLIAAAPSDPGKYLLRFIKVDMLAVEMLADIRELLQRLQPPTIITATEEETHGRDEGLHR